MLQYRIGDRPARFAMLLPTLLLSSCIPLDKPLSHPDKAKPDTRLIGVWRREAKDWEGPECIFHFIGKSGHRGDPPGIMKIAGVGINQEGKINLDPMYFFTTSVGDSSYMNCFEGDVLDQSKFPTWDKGNIKVYLLIKYKIERDKLTIWTACKRSAEAVIRKGQIKGTIQGGIWIIPPDVSLLGGENLSRFLADGGDKVLFPDDEEHKRIFSRVK
jgi:hypothetical protein